jgi:DegV family protein with EDD domain
MNKKIPLLITADSVCDLPGEVIEQYGIVINPYFVRTEKGRFRDGVEIGMDDLLIYMRQEGNLSKSEAPGEEEYKDFFSEQLQRAEQILHITMAKKASEGYNNAKQAAKACGNVTVFDSGQLSSGMGLMVMKAAKMAQEEAGVPRILEELNTLRPLASTSFVVRDTDFLHRSGRLSGTVKNICDRLLLHPMLAMENDSIVAKNIFIGRWSNVIRKYISTTLRRSDTIDKQTLFITHANMDEETLQYIKNETEKYCHFEKIYFQEASSAISCNCGEGAFGLLFLRKVKKTKNQAEGEKAERVSPLCSCKDWFMSTILNEDYDIRQRVLNLILAVALLGGFLALIGTLVMGMPAAALSVIAILIVLSISMYLSVGRHNSRMAGLLICACTNIIILPFTLLEWGGIGRGQPVWLAMSLIFTWLILDGWVGFIMYILSFAAMAACILYADQNPRFVQYTTEGTAADVIVALFFVSAVMGVILRYHSRIYEKQKKDLQEHEQELLTANHAKSTFLANMSHEIRTPINGIIGMDTMLLRECGDNETFKQYGMNIQSASQSLLSIVNDILDISKIESGKLELIPVEYELFSVINDCYNMTASRAAGKGLEFNVDIEPTLPCGLYGDEVRVRQIINNLLSNAVKYTNEGSITLRLNYEQKRDISLMLVISVSDTGIGIRQDDTEKLFESFTRLDEKKNRNVEGTGLGLNLTKNLVAMMDGEITVSSVYGQGSTFQVKIRQNIRNHDPIGDFAKRYHEQMEKQNEDAKIVYAPEARVLVVDDVPMNLLVAKGLLKYTAVMVDTAESGEEALEKIQKTKYDIIFMDHLMPVMDGIECFHRMRNMDNHPNIETPVIVLTANAILGAKEEYIQAGLTDYLSKPIQEKELQAMLMKYLPKEKITLSRLCDLEQGGSDGMKTAASQGTAVENSGAQDAAVQSAESTGEQDAAVQGEPQSLEDIDGLDVELGLSYCMSDMDFYKEMIGEYLKGDKRPPLEEYFSKEDWENYRITAHALKSTSLNIGAKAVSEQAKGLEFAARDNDIDYIKSHHQEVLEQYSILREELTEVIER